MSMPTRKELEIEIERLEEQHKKDLDTLGDVNELLRQADRRRKTERSNQRKWDRVLENLERGLDETKSRITGCEVNLKTARKALDAKDEAPEAAAEPAEESVPEPEASVSEAGGGGYLALAESIACTPLAELHRFTLEQIADVSGRLEREITRENFPDYEKLAAHIEFANQLRSKAGESDENKERRGQGALRAAIDKVLNKQFDAMSPEEMRLILASQDLLLRNLRPGVQDERLGKLIAAGAAVIKRRLDSSH